MKDGFSHPQQWRPVPSRQVQSSLLGWSVSAFTFTSQATGFPLEAAFFQHLPSVSEGFRDGHFLLPRPLGDHSFLFAGMWALSPRSIASAIECCLTTTRDPPLGLVFSQALPLDSLFSVFLWLIFVPYPDFSCTNFLFLVHRDPPLSSGSGALPPFWKHTILALSISQQHADDKSHLLSGITTPKAPDCALGSNTSPS